MGSECGEREGQVIKWGEGESECGKRWLVSWERVGD